MKDHVNYPKPNQPSVISAPVNFNPTADKICGYPDGRGNAVAKGHANYSGQPGNGVVKPKNSPPTS